MGGKSALHYIQLYITCKMDTASTVAVEGSIFSVKGLAASCTEVATTLLDLLTLSKDVATETFLRFQHSALVAIMDNNPAMTVFLDKAFWKRKVLIEATQYNLDFSCQMGQKFGKYEAALMPQIEGIKQAVSFDFLMSCCKNFDVHYILAILELALSTDKKDYELFLENLAEALLKLLRVSHLSFVVANIKKSCHTIELHSEQFTVHVALICKRSTQQITNPATLRWVVKFVGPHFTYKNFHGQSIHTIEMFDTTFDALIKYDKPALGAWCTRLLETLLSNDTKTEVTSNNYLSILQHTQFVSYLPATSCVFSSLFKILGRLKEIQRSQVVTCLQNCAPQLYTASVSYIPGLGEQAMWKLYGFPSSNIFKPERTCIEVKDLKVLHLAWKSVIDPSNLQAFNRDFGCDDYELNQLGTWSNIKLKGSNRFYFTDDRDADCNMLPLESSSGSSRDIPNLDSFRMYQIVYKLALPNHKVMYFDSENMGWKYIEYVSKSFSTAYMTTLFKESVIYGPEAIQLDETSSESSEESSVESSPEIGEESSEESSEEISSEAKRHPRAYTRK